MAGQRTFRDFELDGWSARAPNYDALFATVTNDAIEPLLNGAGVEARTALLDLCCGTGDLVSAALARGADATGVDFSPEMVRIARGKFPDARFETGDAEALPFGDGTFDAVTCAFGLLHIERPERALSEAARALAPGGRIAYATWLGPEDGHDVFRIVNDALALHGSPDADLPAAPSPFLLAERASAEPMLHRAGFDEIRFEKRGSRSVHADGEDVIKLLQRAIVRVPMMIDAQPAPNRQRVLDAIRSAAEERFRDGRIVLDWPYVIVTARKA